MDLRFGDFVLKRRERQVAGPDGMVDLSARSFDILQVLLGHPEQLIGKAQLFDAVWPGLAVEENTLQVHVSALRKLLGPSLIATVHGRGYKYTGPPPVELPGATMERAVPRKPVVTVLPLENLSGDPDQQYFSDGISEDITDRLTRFRMLAVIGQHSAFAFRGSAPDFAAIRAKLKADYVVTGSLRRAGDRIRIAVRLSDASSETAIWAERYDRPLTDILLLQDEVAGLIAAAIAKQLELDIDARSGSGNATSFACYEHILKGHWHFKKLTIAANSEAAAAYQRALAIEPRNAEAMGHLAMCQTSGWLFEFSDSELQKGVALAAEAIEVDPQNAMCHAVLGFGLLWVRGLEAARPPLERAIALNPDGWIGLSNRAMLSIYEGDADGARHYLNLARKLNPLPPIWLTEFECVACFIEDSYAGVLPGVEPITDGAWDMMYALSCYGHLGMKEKALQCLGRFHAQGRWPGFLAGAAREPYVNPAMRERLKEGIATALAWWPE